MNYTTRIKWTYELVKEYVENLGYVLISNKYIDNRQKLVLKDKYGYYYTITLINLKNGYSPRMVDKNNPYSIQNIKLWCNLNNKPFKLISEAYDGNNKKLKWKCFKKECGEEFEMNWASISQGNGCSVCRGMQIRLSNCLATKRPDLAAEWHPNKNNGLTPYDVTEHSRKKVWWQCSKNHEHEWETRIADRSGKIGCPYCAGIKVCLSNCLATKNPELAKEWHSIKNGKLTPYNVTCGSQKKVWWICKKGHEWQATINSRNNKIGCPYCSGRYASEDYNLLIVNPELCKEWNYRRNKNKPEEYTPGSKKKVWWKCKECDHEWMSEINARNNGSGCPQCNESKGEKIIRQTLQNKNKIFIPQYEFNDLLSDLGYLLRFDFAILNKNNKLLYLIEYDGRQHFEWIARMMTYKEFKKLQYHDQLKNKYCQRNNIPLLRIPYWEFDNIEKILIEWLDKVKINTNNNKID